MRRPSRLSFLSAAAGATLVPYVEWVRPAEAQPAPAKLTDIDHIVILMQENRSFDHYFGTLSGVRGFGDANPLLLPNGQPVFYQPDSSSPGGFVLPFNLDTHRTSAQRLNDLSHNWGPLHDSWNGGHMDGWVSAHRKSDGAFGPLTMGYYTRDDLPFYYALADAFTICDGYHCLGDGPNESEPLLLDDRIDRSGRQGRRPGDHWPTGARRSTPGRPIRKQGVKAGRSVSRGASIGPRTRSCFPCGARRDHELRRLSGRAANLAAL